MPSISKESPSIYKLVTKMLHKEEEYLEFEKEVNTLIAEGYEPLGPVQMSHTHDHTDVVQTMVFHSEPNLLKGHL